MTSGSRLLVFALVVVSSLVAATVARAQTPVQIVPVLYPAPVLVPENINVSGGDQYDPHVDGDWTAYSSDSSIRYFSFATGVDAQIPQTGIVRDLLSNISGSKIVFSRTISAITAIMVFDAATAAPPVEIDAAPGTVRIGSAIGGNTVAYIDFGLQARGELVVHDLITSVSVRITNDSTFDQNPAVSPSGDVVVWEHCASSNNNCDIWQAVKTGASWVVSVVSNLPAPESNPDTNGTLVVYDSLIRVTMNNIIGQNNIFWRPVNGTVETQLQLPGYQQNPSIAGGFIAFEGRPTLFATSDIFVYDIVNNRLFNVTDTPFVTEQLNDIAVLPDGSLRVVWASDEDGYDSRNVKGATFRLPNVAPALSYSADVGYGIDGVDPDAGSINTSFTYKAVYTDNQAPSSLNVCIDGICQAMGVDTAANAWLHDGDYKNGEQYWYETTLAPGSHTYFFEGSDGTIGVRLPASGSLSGPAVGSLYITTESLYAGEVGVFDETTVQAGGGTIPYAWYAASLPPGLSMDDETGTISGIPTTEGIYGVTVFVKDSSGELDSKSFTLTVITSPTSLMLRLVTLVDRINLTQGIENSLDAKLNYVLAALELGKDGDPTSACNRLISFINEVEAQAGKAKITSRQAIKLIALAKEIHAALGCP